ncbi:Paraquat-inducible protein A [bacterium HR39]|nr:Paraquat-inducible protein A [bacterium HR39]
MTDGVPVLLCPACDLPHAAVRLPEGGVALCRRCGQMLYRARRGTLPWSAGFLLGALLLFPVANLLPFVALEFGPSEAPRHLLSSAWALWRHGESWLALLLFLLVFLVPLARILAGLWVLLPLLTGRMAPGAGAVFREAEVLRPWAMTEVYLLALVVAWAKLRDLATVDFGPGALAFALVILLLLAAETVLEPMEVWERIAPQTRIDPKRPPAPGALLACGHCR